MKKLKLPILILTIGLIAAVASCFLTGITKAPTITEHDFNYSVTYTLDGETKTLHGVYKCRFSGVGGGNDRFYDDEYTDYGLASHSCAYTIAQKDGFDLAVVTAFNTSYLMGDVENDSYKSAIQEPYLIIYDQEYASYSYEEMPDIFDAEIISWEYPEPIENSFVFAGFSELHETSAVVMILVGFLTLVACLIFVKKEEGLNYGVLDKIGIVLNFLIAIAVFPLFTLVSLLIQMYPTGPHWIYQIELCVPVTILLALAASISFRRKGFAKTGFFVQFLGPALFVVLGILEYIL